MTSTNEFPNCAAPEKSEAPASFVVRPLIEEELQLAAKLTRENLTASVADIEIVQRVFRQNQETFWGLFRKEPGKTDEFCGYLGMLFLNAQGLQAVRDDTFDAADPNSACLSADVKSLEAIYLWCIVAPKRGKLMIDMVARAMGRAYAGLPLYAGAASDAGLKAIEGFGFKPLSPERAGIGGLFLLQRAPGETGTQKPRRNNPWDCRLRTVVATTSDEVEKALAIRAAVFLVEQNCPYAEEFDGNDRTATHIVGYVDDEPAGTLRIRYFADFAKPERLAVLPRFRGTLLAKELVETAFNICKRKGYRNIYGHAEKHLEKFWAKFGFERMSKNYALTFSDHEFSEMCVQIEPHPEALTMNSDPLVLIRPEGSWDTPGILDGSALRPATNPH